MSEAQQINPKVAAYVAEVAAALEGLLARDCGYGEFYVLGVQFGYDGEESGVSLIPDEFGGVAIRITGNPA